MIIVEQGGDSFVDTSAQLVFRLWHRPRDWAVDCHGIGGQDVYRLGTYDTEDAARAALMHIIESHLLPGELCRMPPRGGEGGE